jgi:hypothetical protein
VPLKASASFLLAIVLGSPAYAVAADLRANYDVSLTSHGKTYSIRTAETVTGGQSIVQELGPFDLEMIPEVNESGAYDLQVTVTRRKTSQTDIPISAARTFGGALGGPLEFSAEFGEATVAGALMLSALAGDG